MIKINLLGDETIIDHSARLILAGFLASLALLFVICFLFYRSEGNKLARLTDESEVLEAQLSRLKEVTKEVNELEAKKKEIEQKVAVIATLKRSKSGPVRVLDDLNMALPERAWITEVKEKDGLMRITGYALDNQTIATFMKDLSASSYFESVGLVETKQTDVKNVKIMMFTLDARVNYVGKGMASSQALVSTAQPDQNVDNKKRKAAPKKAEET